MACMDRPSTSSRLSALGSSSFMLAFCRVECLSQDDAPTGALTDVDARNGSQGVALVVAHHSRPALLTSNRMDADAACCPGRPKKNPPQAGRRQRPMWGQVRGLSAYNALRTESFPPSVENFWITYACRDRCRVSISLGRPRVEEAAMTKPIPSRPDKDRCPGQADPDRAANCAPGDRVPGEDLGRRQ